MNDPVFPKGLSIKQPNEKAPDFVKGSISIKRQEFLDWLSHQTGEWINLDMKVSKRTGKWYSQVNDYKPSTTKPVNATQADPAAVNPAVQFAPAPQDDLPFNSERNSLI